MLRNIIKPFLFLPFSFYLTTQKPIFGEMKNNIDEVIEEKTDEIFIKYQEIENLIFNNEDLKSLKELEKSAKLNLSSTISQKYPTIDLQANGLPKYVAGKNYNSNSQTTKTSQFSANPTLNISWDLIDPLRGSEIEIAKNNYKIAKNNFEIKRKDLIQEAKLRYHKYQKSFRDIENKQFALDLSITSLENAKSKFDAGIGTRFEVLEADAQLSRDEQSLNETKIQHTINRLSLIEILNIKDDFKIEKDQNLIGYWNYHLNKTINFGLEKSLSLKNIALRKLIKEQQADKFLNSYKPKIYLSNTFASAFSKGDSLALSINSDKSASAYTNTISLNFMWNIFDGGQNKKSQKAKKVEAKAEEYSFNNIKNILKANINKAYLNIKLNEEKILSSLKEIESTKESLRLARLRYDVGISTLKDVLIRQKEYSDAKSKNINAIYNYNSTIDELERLTFLEKNNNCIDKNDNTIKKNESICYITR